jgi:murein DD-endopeptidase MepM/ murein hydrolase activator NlpD
MTPVFPTIPTAVITQGFNNLNPKYYGGDGRHKGVDFGVSANSPVYACMAGVVETSVALPTGYGRHIRIRHEDGSLSIYGHLNKLMVSMGDKVEAGQPIGLSGGDPKDAINCDGNSTGAHLHWEIRPAGATSDQQAVDPMAYCANLMPPGTPGVCISAPGLNIRSSPSTNGALLYSIHKGDKVTIMGRTNDWYQLRSLRPEWCYAPLIKVGDIFELSFEKKVALLWDAHPELH